MTVAVPEGLLWWRERPGGAAWLERLPRLVGECAAAWGLHLRAPFPRATVSFVAPAVLGDGTQAVLKVNFPDAESEHEPDALAAWGGRGAVRLLAGDPERRALLVERCMPGTQLWAVRDETQADRAAAGVLRALWRPLPEDHAFRALDEEARRWAAELLASPDGPPVLVHQDLHGGNVLRAGREAWLAIDPKPLAGERAFDVASLLRDRRGALAADPHPVRRIAARLDRLSEALDLDRERMRRWAVVHALAWGMGDDEWFPEIVACAEWLDRARADV